MDLLETMPSLLTQHQVLSVNRGNVRLVENDAQTAIQVVRFKPTLPNDPVPNTAFDSNPFFRAAKQQTRPFAVFQSLSKRTILVCPTRPYASIRDFATRAPLSEWKALWAAVYRVRDALQRRYGGHFYIGTIGIDVPQLHIRLARRRNVVYRLFCNSTIAPVDQAIIVHHANDPKGWCGRFKCSIQLAPSRVQSDVTLAFKSPAFLRINLGPSFEQLSVSILRQGHNPRIYFNRRNWTQVPPGFTGTLSQYRRYVVQHELGHALFHLWSHDEPTHGVCPVMMQQTKGTAACTPSIRHPHIWNAATDSSIGPWLAALK